MQDSDCSDNQSDCSIFVWTSLPYNKICYYYVYLPLYFWQGYFRYAKAYYHLGFHDKAMAINIQAQTRCGQTTELIQQAAMFTKGNCNATQS
jgi:hypothetical protein